MHARRFGLNSSEKSARNKSSMYARKFGPGSLPFQNQDVARQLAHDPDIIIDYE